MKKTLIALATLGALTGVAHADSNVSIYGIIDASGRIANHQDSAGSHLESVGNGILQGNRIGFKGQEDLGNGLKAIFQLESGFNIGNGTAAQNGGLFSRNATVGLSDRTLGTVTLGRQNNLAYDTLIQTDVYGVANNNALSGYQSVLSGLRWDNSVKYTNKYDGFNFGADYSSGNQVGNINKNSGYGVNAGYTGSNWGVQGVYQLGHDTKDATLGTLPGQKQEFWAVGGTYSVTDKTGLFAQYVHNRFEVTDQTNSIVTLGVSQKLAGNWTLRGAATHDKQDNVGEGTRQTYSAVLGYAFSKRTDVYGAVDYNKLGSGYTNAAYTLNTAANTSTNATGLSLGLRHLF